MFTEKLGNRLRLTSRTLASFAMVAALFVVGLGGVAGCGTGIYQDFTNAISGCDGDDCDDCDDCGGGYYDDCYYGDCYGGGWWDFGFGLGFLDGWFW